MSAMSSKKIVVWFALSVAAYIPALAMAGPLDGLADSLKGAAPALTSVVAEKYGLTDNQAAGGVGSILSLAKEKLKPSDYTQLASAIPGAAGYIDKAKSLGAVTGKIGNRQGLNTAFGKLGITPEVGSQLISTVVDYAGKLGGGKTATLLSALK
jgi:hypothetical protein